MIPPISIRIVFHPAVSDLHHDWPAPLPVKNWAHFPGPTGCWCNCDGIKERYGDFSPVILPTEIEFGPSASNYPCSEGSEAMRRLSALFIAILSIPMVHAEDKPEPIRLCVALLQNRSRQRSRQRSHAVRKSSATSSVAETNWNGNVVLLLGSRMERVGERLSIRSADAGDVVPANLGMQGRRAGARLGEETEGVTVGPKRDHERSVL